MFAWNVVKSFVHTLFENKTNDMAAKVGIFIRSSKRLDDIIEACNNLIQNSKSGGRITTVRKENEGVKVYLNGDDIAQELLTKQFLYETGDLSTIHPLTTHLTVQDAIFSIPEEEFIEALRNVFQEIFGPVLKVSKVPISKLYPDIGNGNWRILLDVPEIEDQDIYKKSGLPDNFTIEVPGVHGKLSVTFYCTKCEKDGHTQWRCSESIKKETKSFSLSGQNSTAGTPKTAPSGFFIRDREEENNERDATPKNKPMLKRKKIKEFESEIGKEEVRNYCDTFHSKDSRGVKKEVGQLSSSDKNSVVKSLLFSVRDEEEPHSKKIRIDDDSQPENLAKASSTTNDADCLEIIHETSPSIKSQNLPLFSPPGGLFSRNFVDDSVSTSNQPAPIADTIKEELPSTDENESDSNHSFLTAVTKPVRQRKKPAQGVPIVIPDRIQKIISEIEGAVLDVQMLTAFFNHVKKKSKPCNFAKMYTNNVDGLKGQLMEIKRRYYMIPDRGTNAEIQFMKWFVNILDRFEGTPSTRKKRT